MSFLERISHAGKILFNTEANEIQEAGVGFGVENEDPEAINLVDKVPFKVKRTVKNCRMAAQDPLVAGILADRISKSNSTFTIESNNPEAAEYLRERAKEWDLTGFIDDKLYKGPVDGEAFTVKTIVDNKIKLRDLAFDGDNYRIKIIYDEYGEVIGYKQLTQRNKDTNKGWLSKKFDELVETFEELTTSFEPGEIIHFKYLERRGRGRSQVMNILDPVYYKRVLEQMMPPTAFKNSNVMMVTIGNSDKKSLKLSKNDRDKIAENASNYHKKGVIVFDYGIEAKMIGTSHLPDIPKYIEYYESLIFKGMATPEVVFSSESSNRATAEVQMDSKETGQILSYQYDQEWIKKYIENELFQHELELNGFDSDVKAWLNFNTTDEDNDAPYLETEKESYNKVSAEIQDIQRKKDEKREQINGD